MHISGMVTQYGTLLTPHILNLSPFQNRNTWLVTVSMFPWKQSVWQNPNQDRANQNSSSGLT